MTRPCYLLFLTLLLVLGAFQSVQKAFASDIVSISGLDILSYSNYATQGRTADFYGVNAPLPAYVFLQTNLSTTTGSGNMPPCFSNLYGSHGVCYSLEPTYLGNGVIRFRASTSTLYYGTSTISYHLKGNQNLAVSGLYGASSTNYFNATLSDNPNYFTPISSSSLTITTTNNAVFTGNPIYITAIYTNNADYDTIAWNLLNNTYAQVIITATSSIPLTQVANYAFQHPFNLGLTGSYSLAGQLQNSSTGSTSNWSNTLNFTLTSTGNATSTGSSSVLFIPETCGSFDFFCQLKNAFLWGLIPSADSLNQFVSLKTQIQNKPPFGYLTILTNNLSNATTTGATAFTLTIPQYLKDFVFDPIKTGLSAILWFVGLIWLYKRLTHIQL